VVESAIGWARSVVAGMPNLSRFAKITAAMTFRAIEGGGVLLLLSVFFAYLLAPAVAAVRRRVRFGRRQRPVTDATAIALIYMVIFVPTAVLWPAARDGVSHWVHVTAPEAVDHLFRGGKLTPLNGMIARAPLSAGARSALAQRVDRSIGYIERETRQTLDDLLTAAPYAAWLAVAPLVAFLLLTGAPGFQRSALRVLPRGHLQWRGEEYLRDVNSALAGYVRAQTAAAFIVGALCVCGFVLLGLPNAVSMGVAAGILELIPGIGPLVALIMAASQAGDRVLFALAFLGGLRIVQDYAIYPRLVRRGMHLSTFAVILTIWAGAALAGAAGVILALPVAGFLSVSLRHWREYRDIERLVRQPRL
jgi:predicted PurR-regulated permease PerM